ncbi:hypothetical protein [Campylobacter sp. RM12637]|uniref:hypothetical protein n=1 Tax=Campylobacter sp. RM12637 TaxID=2735734 RepID=UPI0030155B8E|nr:hypothetical protein [Campylobacter sp. RM12637]
MVLRAIDTDEILLISSSFYTPLNEVKNLDIDEFNEIIKKCVKMSKGHHENT